MIRFLYSLLRTAQRNKLYTTINIVGLAVAFVVFILIFTLVRHELSYDRFHTKSDEIYRVKFWRQVDGSEADYALVHWPVGPKLTAEYSQVKNYTRLYFENTILGLPDEQPDVRRLAAVDSTFFQVFDVEFIHGSPETALQDLNSIVLVESVAKKYFGETNPLGKTLLYQGAVPFKVTGVVKDDGYRSHIEYEALFPIPYLGKHWGWDGFDTNWVWTAVATYLVIESPKQASELELALGTFGERYYPDNIKDNMALNLQPLKSIHLHSDLDAEIKANGDFTTVVTLIVVAILLVLIASFNFMNLTSAIATTRLRQAGVKKVLGARQSSMLIQGLSESMAFGFIAAAFSLVLAYYLLPWFSGITGQRYHLSIADGGLWLLAFGLATFVGLLAGLHPSLMLAKVRSFQALRGQVNASVKKSWFGKALVIFQFMIAMILMIGLGTVVKQQQFINSKELGFSASNVIVVHTRGFSHEELMLMTQKMLTNPNIIEAGIGISFVGEGIDNFRFQIEGFPPNSPHFVMVNRWAYHLPALADMEIVVGRNFSEDFVNDPQSSFLVNETAVKQWGWDDPIGKELERFTFSGGKKSGKVIGVVRDFHQRSLHHPVEPMIVEFGGWRIFAKISDGSVESLLPFLKQEYKKHTTWPFKYVFLQDEIDDQYSKEMNLARVAQWSAGLTLFVAVLGLFGITAFSSARRTREIGIRKILGATRRSLVLLMASNYAKLIGLAFIIALPIGLYFANSWLNSFAYRTNVGVEILLIAILIGLFVGLFTISYHTITVSGTDPVKTLRDE